MTMVGKGLAHHVNVLFVGQRCIAAAVMCDRRVREVVSRQQRDRQDDVTRVHADRYFRALMDSTSS